MSIFTAEGLALIKNNGKVVAEALKANEKALSENKWLMSSKTKDGKPRQRLPYVQMLRGKMEAYREMAEGVRLEAWEPKPRTSAPASVNVDEIVKQAVAAALKAAGL